MELKVKTLKFSLVLYCIILVHTSHGFWDGDGTKHVVQISAIYDYKTETMFYRDESIGACFLESYENNDFNLMSAVIIPEFDRKAYMPEIINSSLAKTICGELPIHKVTSLVHIPIDDEISTNDLDIQSRTRQKRSVANEHYRQYPPPHWHQSGPGSQTQIQGQVTGQGFFSGQAQSQHSGVSQSQVQLGGTGILGSVSSSTGNSQAQIALGTGDGSGQAASSGVGPSNSQVQVNLGHEGRGSMASASVLAGQGNQLGGHGSYNKAGWIHGSGQAKPGSYESRSYESSSDDGGAGNLDLGAGGGYRQTRVQQHTQYHSSHSGGSNGHQRNQGGGLDFSSQNLGGTGSRQQGIDQLIQISPPGSQGNKYATHATQQLLAPLGNPHAGQLSQFGSHLPSVSTQDKNLFLGGSGYSGQYGGGGVSQSSQSTDTNRGQFLGTGNIQGSEASHSSNGGQFRGTEVSHSAQSTNGGQIGGGSGISHGSQLTNGGHYRRTEIRQESVSTNGQRESVRNQVSQVTNGAQYRRAGASQGSQLTTGGQYGTTGVTEGSQLASGGQYGGTGITQGSQLTSGGNYGGNGITQGSQLTNGGQYRATEITQGSQRTSGGQYGGTGITQGSQFTNGHSENEGVTGGDSSTRHYQRHRNLYQPYGSTDQSSGHGAGSRTFSTHQQLPQAFASSYGGGQAQAQTVYLGPGTSDFYSPGRYASTGGNGYRQTQYASYDTSSQTGREAANGYRTNGHRQTTSNGYSSNTQGHRQTTSNGYGSSSRPSTDQSRTGPDGFVQTGQRPSQSGTSGYGTFSQPSVSQTGVSGPVYTTTLSTPVIGSGYADADLPASNVRPSTTALRPGQGVGSISESYDRSGGHSDNLNVQTNPSQTYGTRVQSRPATSYQQPNQVGYPGTISGFLQRPQEQSGVAQTYGISLSPQYDAGAQRCTITFTCTVIVESNGRAKICRPNSGQTNGSNGNGGTSSGTPRPSNGGAICCC